MFDDLIEFKNGKPIIGDMLITIPDSLIMVCDAEVLPRRGFVFTDADHSILIDVETDHYKVSGYDAFYGFISGIIAGDHDITDVLVDATLKIGGRDYEALANFLEKVAELSKIAEQDITFTVSCDESDLPERIFTFCEKI